MKTSIELYKQDVIYIIPTISIIKGGSEFSKFYRICFSFLNRVFVVNIAFYPNYIITMVNEKKLRLFMAKLKRKIQAEKKYIISK
jgi:hypothetical protein